MKRMLPFLFLFMSALALPTAAQEATPPAEPPYEIFVPEVVAEYPHRTTDFTQGLVWSPDGRLFQSTGQYEESRLQELDPVTGEVLREVFVNPVAEGTPDPSVDRTSLIFAEGLALAGDRLIQLTWKQGEAYVYDVDTFERVGQFNYEGEGWGLCYDGEALWMSDGSPNLFKRDPETFELLDTIPVTIEGQPVPEINELECVGGDVIWANVWQTPYILRIDKASGEVTGIVDGRPLITEEMINAWASGAVLNGIAWIPERETFLVTGKNWPVTYEVTFELVETGP